MFEQQDFPLGKWVYVIFCEFMGNCEYIGNKFKRKFISMEAIIIF